MRVLFNTVRAKGWGKGLINAFVFGTDAPLMVRSIAEMDTGDLQDF